jgi:hypothetical protein
MHTKDSSVNSSLNFHLYDPLKTLITAKTLLVLEEVKKRVAMIVRGNLGGCVQ